MTLDKKRKQRGLVALRALLAEAKSTVAPEVRSDINVTPLVDVVLVLLIIFMVVTPMIASGVAVDLPRTANHSRKPDDGKDIVVAVTRDASLYVGSTRVPRIEQLAEIVAAERRRFPDKTIFLKGDARTSFGAVKRVMQTLHEAEIEDIVVATEEIDRGAAGQE